MSTNAKPTALLAPRQAADRQRARERAPRIVGNTGFPVTIRRSTETDLSSIREIAQLDSQRPPGPPFLVAEVDEEMVAAIATEAGVVVANPFRHTAQAVALLRLAAEHLASNRPPARTDLRRAIRRAGSAALGAWFGPRRAFPSQGPPRPD